MMPLRYGVRTLDDYHLPVTIKGERAKRLLRRFGYPIYNAINHPFLARRYKTADFQPDLWLWG